MPRKVILVFGSNLKGRHGQGAALDAAKYHGAIEGQASGLQGDSYGIPTKDSKMRVLHIGIISMAISQFIEFAKANPDLLFVVTRIGCGRSRYKNEDIAPLFRHAPKNCEFDMQWKPILGEEFTYFTYHGK